MPSTALVIVRVLSFWRKLGQAKVGQVRLALRVEKNVARLEIAMKHAALMREMHRPRDGNEEAGAFVNREGICSCLPSR